MSHSDPAGESRERFPGGGPAAGLALVAGTLAVVTVAALFALWGYAFTPGPPVAVQVEIPAGGGLGTVRHRLAAAGVLPDDRRFDLLAVLMGVSGRLRSGEYLLPAGVTPYGVIGILVRGRQVLRRVTIPEGLTVAEIAGRLAAAGVVADRHRFLALCRDAALCRRLGIPAGTLEGYLFPDTYSFARHTDPRRVIEVMVRRGEEVWQELTAGQEPDMGRHAVLTLASIVEKETSLPEERPLVAGVFLERLRRGMRLQADPTVIYGVGAFGRPLTRRDLAAATPYNTYRHTGLPPGPIANPGRAAIASVLRPQQGYLYFVSRNDGSHVFSRTLREHNRAVQRYQRRGRAGRPRGGMPFTRTSKE